MVSPTRVVSGALAIALLVAIPAAADPLHWNRHEGRVDAAETDAAAGLGRMQDHGGFRAGMQSDARTRDRALERMLTGDRPKRANALGRNRLGNVFELGGGVRRNGTVEHNYGKAFAAGFFTPYF